MVLSAEAGKAHKVQQKVGIWPFWGVCLRWYRNSCIHLQSEGVRDAAFWSVKGGAGGDPQVKVITEQLVERGQGGQREVAVLPSDYYLLRPDRPPEVTDNIVNAFLCFHHNMLLCHGDKTVMLYFLKGCCWYLRHRASPPFHWLNREAWVSLKTEGLLISLII